MRAENQSTPHNRTIQLTEIPPGKFKGPAEMKITINYVLEGRPPADYGIALDGFVIPEILGAINQKALADEAARKEVKDVPEAIQHIAGRMALDLEIKALELWGKLTEKERYDLDRSGKLPFAVAKILLVALVDNGRVHNQWSAEGIEKDIKRIRRIERNRP